MTYSALSHYIQYCVHCIQYCVHCIQYCITYKTAFWFSSRCMQLLALGDFKVLSCESGIASLSL